MTDISTGLFTLGGAAIGAIGTQISGIIRTSSKSRARKQRAAQLQRDSQSDWMRDLYTDFIKNLRAANTVVRSARTTVRPMQASATLRAATADGRANLRKGLAGVRDSATQVQIDGSEEALKIATNVLNGIDQLEQLVAEESMIGMGELDRVTELLTKAETDMINLSRKDFGAEAK
jgi:hypothetical protein